jgi:hypothetical protein
MDGETVTKRSRESYEVAGLFLLKNPAGERILQWLILEHLKRNPDDVDKMRKVLGIPEDEEPLRTALEYARDALRGLVDKNETLAMVESVLERETAKEHAPPK